GTASRLPTYPTIPHMLALRLPLAWFLRLAPPRLGPALLDHLPGPAEGQRSGGHVRGDGAARRDVCARADGDRSDERRVAADEGPRLDARGMLVDAVVVAGDRPGPDVDSRPHGGVPDVGQVGRLGAVPE